MASRITHKTARTALATAALSVIAMASLGACAAQAPNQPSANADQAVTIGLTYIPNVQFSPLYVAEKDGMFAQEKVAVELRHHGADEGLFTALTTGKEDLVVASGDELLQARAQGMDLVSVGSYYTKYPVTVIVEQSSGITTFEDLKGKKVGLPGEYGSTWLGLLAGLEAHGLTTADIDVVPIGYTAQASLVSGKVDAVVGFSNNDLVQFQTTDVPVRAIDLVEGEVPLVSAALVTTQDWLDEDPQRAKAVVAAIEDGMASVVADQDNALEATATYDTTLSDATARSGAQRTLAATVELFKDADGNVSARQDLEKWEAMHAFLSAVPGLIQGDARPDGAVTNDFVSE